MSYFARIKEEISKIIHKQPEHQFLHFLHIGKTGGTALVYALNEYGYCAQSPERARANRPNLYNLNPQPENSKLTIYVHAHNETLRSVPEGEKFFFFLRDPISRFTSGFYSRQRQGKPRYNSPWTEAEKRAYERFEIVNQLALALTSANPDEKKAAENAMKSIQHVRDSFWEWFENEEYFRSRWADIFFIGFQETLAQDFETLKAKLHLPANVSLPSDVVLAYKNVADVDKKLDPIALQNLKDWYKDDYRLIELCKEFLKHT